MRKIRENAVFRRLFQKFGGLLKSSSRLAMMAAAGILVSGVTMSSAKAADLGGDCCADLEERVAELEATTARKGNRKVGLTVSGQVSRAIMYYNDGVSSKTFAGLDSRVESSRFIFSGNAKITPRVTAGFEMMIDIGLGAQTSGVSNASGPTSNANAGNPNVDGGWGGDSVLAVRTANWYLEDKQLGRLTVGRINAGGAVATIDLGGIGTGATARPALFGGGLQFRNSTTGALSGLAIGSAAFGHCQGCDRFEGIVWDSQSLGGFLLRAAWGENDVSTYSIRYAGEFSGFQIAAGIGVQKQSRAGQIDTSGPSVSAVTGSYGASSQSGRPVDDWGASLAIKHVPSGIFGQGHYAWSDYSKSAGNASDRQQSNWMVQGGVSKNWFGPGDTAVYGEYGEGKNNILELGPNFAGETSKATFWGIGVNQKIDAAAMEIYAGWRRYDLTASSGVTNTNGIPTAAVATSNAALVAGGLEAIDIVFTGARIRF